MIKDIQGIKLGKGGFLSNIELEFFKSTSSATSRLAFIYGKNGSGKSTIARSIREAALLVFPPVSELPLFLDSNANVMSVEGPLNNVFVFDETYIDLNIKFHRDNLDTIVLLGKHKVLDDELEKAKDELSNLKNDEEKLKKEKKDFETPSSKNSKLYWLSKIKEALKGDINWAGRDRQIKGNRNNTSVNDDTFKQFKKPIYNKNELAIKFKEVLEELNEKRESQSIKLPYLSLNVLSAFNTNEFLVLLNETLQVNTLTNRENKIIELVETSNLTKLDKIKEYFEKEDSRICPYCFQEISLIYKSELLDSISKILNKEVEEYKDRLEAYKVPILESDIEYNFEPYEVLKSANLDKLKNIWKKYIDELKLINSLVITKQSSPYSPLVEFINIQIELYIKELKNLVVAINKEVDEYNSNHSIDNLKSILFQINSDMAYYDISEYVVAYDLCVDKETKFLQGFHRLKESIQEKSNEITNIKQKMRNEKIAIDLMNKWLAYIFYSDNRLKVKYKDGQYYLLSRGESVSPDKVSVGERNAIALCYFFLSTMQGDSESQLYKKECLLVIDDPISSIDVDNRVGILSFLRYQLEQYLSQNENTKILVLTHDLQVFYDMEKIGKQIIECYDQKTHGTNNTNNTRRLNINKFKLQNKQLELLTTKNYHEYTKLLEKIYAYANGRIEDTNEEINIGNSMRRVLEAFSTFLFKKGIDQVTYCSEVQDDLERYRLCDYFRNYLYRFVLHGGSHMEERVKGLVSTDFIDYISIEEKQRTAKDIILFLYCINKGHILAHLKNENEVESTIESWIRNAQNII